MTISQRIEQVTAYIQKKLGDTVPRVGMILGSGLGDYADGLDSPVCIPYEEIPGFLVSTVEGHRGRFVIGLKGGQAVIAMQGRFHYYEGYSQDEIAIPVRVMKKLGVETLIITNAAGGINEAFTGGTLMLITDHINYSGSNPLIGANLDEFGPRFPDMTSIYDSQLGKALSQRAAREGIHLEKGVYVMFSGPSYETPAEIRFARNMGADAVGMSTVPEAIAAAHSGLRVLGISCITNMAAGINPGPLAHAEVMETAERVHRTFTRLLDMTLIEVLQEI